MPNISITAYTRSEDKSRPLHVKTYQIPPQPRQMEIRVGDVCLYMNIADARALADAMLAELKVTAA